MSDKVIKAVVVEPGQKARIEDIACELKDLQAIVNGYIQAIYPFDDPVAIICNEEGKLYNLKPNRAVFGDDNGPGDIIAGTFIVLGTSEDSFCGLSDELAAKYQKQYLRPETFIMTPDNKIKVSYQDDDVNVNPPVIKVWAKESVQYHALSRFADVLSNCCDTVRFVVGQTYFDHGQDWKWTTILARPVNGDDGWQALNPRQANAILYGSYEDRCNVKDELVKEAYKLCPSVDKEGPAQL